MLSILNIQCVMLNGVNTTSNFNTNYLVPFYNGFFYHSGNIIIIIEINCRSVQKILYKVSFKIL